jgi:hypothetical protein
MLEYRTEILRNVVWQANSILLLEEMNAAVPARGPLAHRSSSLPPLNPWISHDFSKLNHFQVPDGGVGQSAASITPRLRPS